MTNKIALVEYGGGCSQEEMIIKAQNLGAVAVILLDCWEVCSYSDQNNAEMDNKIPAICVDKNLECISNFSTFVNNSFSEGIVVNVQFVPGENPMRSLSRGGMLFVQIFFLSVFSALIVWSIVRLVYFYRMEERFTRKTCLGSLLAE